MNEISPIITSRFAQVSDTQQIKKMANELSPQAKYAAYYYAMLSLFVPETSLVTTDSDGKINGAIIGIHDFDCKRMLITHYVSSLDLTLNHSIVVKQQLARDAFRQASKMGAQSIAAQLDTDRDLIVEQILNEVSQETGLPFSVSFQGSNQPEFLPEIPHDLDREKITYRASSESDAKGIWSLVADINKKGGLDLYALTNYERLCRHFSGTCCVAEIEGHIIGFATGYLMPDDHGQKGLFMWQTGVHEKYRGIGTTIETSLIERVNPDYLVFTVEGVNDAANRTAEKKRILMNERAQGSIAFIRDTPDEIGAIALGEHLPEVIHVVASHEKAKLLGRQYCQALKL